MQDTVPTVGNAIVSQVFSTHPSGLSTNTCCSFHDRNGSVITEVVTPSPSDPKKTFARHSTLPSSHYSSAHPQEHEKSVPPYPVDLEEGSSLVFQREPHLSTEAHGPPFHGPQVVGPNAATTGRNTSSATVSGSPLQPGKSRVMNELDQITEQC